MLKSMMILKDLLDRVKDVSVLFDRKKVNSNDFGFY
jgi:hypothetical protein